MGSHRLTTGKTGSAEPHWCPIAREYFEAGSIDRIMQYTAQGSPKGYERAKGSAFNMHWKQAKSLHHTQQGDSFTSLQRPAKGWVDFLSATSLPLGRLLDDNRHYWLWIHFAFGAFFQKAVRFFCLLKQLSLTMSIIKWPQMTHLSADCWKPEYCKDKNEFHKGSWA